MQIRPTYSLHDNQAATNTPSQIREAARQLESQFARMMVKSMRDASFGDSLFPGQNQLFRDMYDDQLAQTLSQGRGLGLQAAIVRQLGGEPETAPAPTPAAGTLSYNNALRAYQSQLPATGNDALDQTLQAPMHAALDAIAGRDTHALHAATSEPSAPASLMAPSGLDSGDELASLAAGDWTRLDDRWRQPASEGAAPTDLAARHAAAQLGTGTPEAFVASIWPHAQRAARELGVDPRGLVAQAALETAWGKRLPVHGDGRSANNLFGIKATGWKGDSVRTGTHEYVNGQRRNESASFRSYSSVADSFNDYVRLLKNNKRYQGALAAGNDIAGFARGLQRGGYATDPSYANKISAIAGGSTIKRALAAIDSVQTRLTPANAFAMNR